MIPPRRLAQALAGLLVFASLAQAGHDLWSATLVHVFVLALSVAVLFSTCWRPRSPGFPSIFLLPTALMAAVFSLSYSGAVNPSESFHALMDWLAALGVFLTALAIFVDDDSLEAFLPVIVPIFWVELLVNLYQQSVSWHPLLEQTAGTLINPNVSAAFLLAWLPVLFDRVKKAPRSAPWARWYWISGLAACLASFALAQSLLGWICLAAMTPFFVTQRRTTRKVILATILLLAGSAVVWKFSHTQDMAGNPVSQTEAAGRAQWWASGLDMFADHPWLGIGVGNYPSAYRAYKVGTGQNTLYAHSFPIELAAETGVVGFLCVMSFFGWWLLRLRRGWARVRARAPYALGLAAFLLSSAVSLNLEFLANTLLCALFLGLLAAPGTKELVKPPRWALIAFAGFAAISLPHLISPWTASQSVVSGMTHLRDRHPARAAAAFNDALASDPHSYTAHRGLAKIHYAGFAATGDREALARAVFHQRETIRLNGLIGLFWWELGAYLDASGAKEEAGAALAKARQLTPGAPSSSIR